MVKNGKYDKQKKFFFFDNKKKRHRLSDGAGRAMFTTERVYKFLSNKWMGGKDGASAILAAVVHDDSLMCD